MPREETRRTSYHHGDLPRILVAQATALLDERGVEKFSVREVARRAGVAPAAPSHHFGNATGLLTAVASEGFRRLSLLSESVLSSDRSPMDRVILAGEGFLEFARKQPGTFSIMFRPELLDLEDPEMLSASKESLELLRHVVREALSDDASQAKVELLASALMAMWHGMLTIMLESPDDLSSHLRLGTRALVAGADSLG